MKISLLPGWGLGLAPLQPLADSLSRQHEVQLLQLPECATPEQALDELDAQMAADSWLAGWSLGGMLATTLAYRRGGDCPGLITLGSNACFVTRDDWPHAMPKPEFNRFSRRAARDWAGTFRRFELLCLQGEEAVAAGAAGGELQAFTSPASVKPVRMNSYLQKRTSAVPAHFTSSIPVSPNPVTPGLDPGIALTGTRDGSNSAMTGDAPRNPVIPVPSNSVIPGLDPGISLTGTEMAGSSSAMTGDAPPNPAISVSFNSVIPGLDPGISLTGTGMAGSSSAMTDGSMSPANHPAAAASLAWLAELDNRPAIADLRCPQLHLLAEQDALVPVAVADALRRLNPQAQVDVQPGSHAFILTRYRDVAERMLAFMARSQGRKPACT